MLSMLLWPYSFSFSYFFAVFVGSLSESGSAPAWAVDGCGWPQHVAKNYCCCCFCCCCYCCSYNVIVVATMLLFLFVVVAIAAAAPLHAFSCDVFHL